MKNDQDFNAILVCCSKFEASLRYVRPCLKSKNRINRTEISNDDSDCPGVSTSMLICKIINCYRFFMISVLVILGHSPEPQLDKERLH